MAKGGRRAKARVDGLFEATDYRHGAKRKNIPPAKIGGEGEIPRQRKVKYAYSPHLDPVLRYDPDGRTDAVQAVVEKACRCEKLTPAEEETLRAIGANWEQPWLEWAGKQEEHRRQYCSVDPVALHIHERISTQAIIRSALRKESQRALFADPEQAYSEAVQFYKHDVDWANRLILGDSLEVMSSLAHRENLVGQVQMVFMDPPYGIEFKSNFQPLIGKREVRDKDEDLPREAEVVKAFRDTWTLGTSSYLSYLRDRLAAARELLAPSGSIFVQIGAQNLHLVRNVLDEVFKRKNALRVIPFKKSGAQTTDILPSNFDFLLWYARDRQHLKARPVLVPKEETGAMLGQDILVERRTGQIVRGVFTGFQNLDEGSLALTHRQASSPGASSGDQSFEFAGRRLLPPEGRHWSVSPADLARAAKAEWLFLIGKSLRVKDYISPLSRSPLGNVWTDTSRSGFAAPLRYVVETPVKVIERCVLMTTDPGDLVLDPTCGSGNTACVAEEWGRRWITIDASRVSIAIARQSILVGQYPHYRTKAGPVQGSAAENPGSGFVYVKVPHTTLKSIARNVSLESICSRHDQELAASLRTVNAILSSVGQSVRSKLRAKLTAKGVGEGKRAISEADRRRWLLPPENRDPELGWSVDPAFAGWYAWEVPYDIDPDWPTSLQDAVTSYRKAWRTKMDEVMACVEASAEKEELVDEPERVKGVVRVSGPFTVEGVIPGEVSLSSEGGSSSALSDALSEEGAPEDDNTQAYLKGMLDAIRGDGVVFPGNKVRGFSRVEPLSGSAGFEGIHAEGAWEGEDDLSVAIAFGPQYGPVTAAQVEEWIRSSRRYRHLVVAGFSFAPEASAVIEESRHPKLQIHMAHIRPDMNPAMRGLLKETPRSQLFTVFGLPAVKVHPHEGGKFTVELEGVDIYDPVTNTIHSTRAKKVATWFLDSDFDGRCFCVCQAFFPDRDAWEKIANALGRAGDPEVFEAFDGTVSLPFKPGKFRRVAVKVIDPRGNEVMSIRRLEE